MERRYKRKDEWKKLIHKLSPKDFQDLCLDILNNNNFINPRPRGDGSDGGRDLEAEFSYDVARQKITEKYWFQCKRYGTTALNLNSFSTEAQKADDQNIDKFVIMSNKDLSSGGKTDIENWNKKHKCKIIDWTGSLFLPLLFESPNVCTTYFPDEPVPKVVDIKEPQSLIPASKNLGDRFGLEININTKNVNINNPIEVGKAVKDALLNLNTDVNLKSLIYEKCSMFFFSIRQNDDAIAFLNRSLDITPKNTNALLTKGYILERINELDSSNEVYDELLEIDKDNVLALNNKSFNLLRQGKLDDSLELIEKALEINPKLVIAIKNKIKILKGLKQPKIALDFLSKNESAFEKSLELMNEKVDLCIELIDLKQAFD